MKNIFIVFLLFTLTACSGFLEEYSQDLAKVETVDDLNELLLGDAYLPVGFYEEYNSSALQPYNLFIHFMSDELQQGAINENHLEVADPEALFGYFTWQRQVGMNPKGTSISSEDRCWKKSYKYINTTNMILDELDGVTARNKSEELDKIRIEGEAYFLRALYYFTLANLYAAPYEPSKAASTPGIPLKLTSYIEDKDYHLGTLFEVYAQIINDLEKAEACLKQTERVSIYHADLTATYLLMSRVYLYMQDYPNTRKYAQLVLDRNDALTDLNGFADEKGNFLNASLSEIVFSMGGHQLSTGIMGYEGRRHYDNERPFYISEDLCNAFNDNDLRKKHYIKKEGDYFIFQKVRWDMKEHAASKCPISDNYLFRTTEAYLNLAEAAALDNDEDIAREKLQLLRGKRYKTPPALNATGNALVDSIRLERQRELCLEGHRWYDLRRYTVCDKYRWSKEYTHVYYDFKIDPDTYSQVISQARYYRLEKDDKAYTLALPREVIEFQNTLGKNERPDREPYETINY